MEQVPHVARVAIWPHQSNCVKAAVSFAPHTIAVSHQFVMAAAGALLAGFCTWDLSGEDAFMQS